MTQAVLGHTAKLLTAGLKSDTSSAHTAKLLTAGLTVTQAVLTEPYS